MGTRSCKSYLHIIFTYAGSLSLSDELEVVRDTRTIAPGDVFIQGGSPGHAVIVVDVAEASNGDRVFLLAQSYMPAQDVHVLVNPADAQLSPWYRGGQPGPLRTPEWTFPPGSLRRFTGSLSIRGASPLGLPHTLSRASLRRRASAYANASARPRRSASGAKARPVAWLARDARSRRETSGRFMRQLLVSCDRVSVSEPVASALQSS